MTNRPCFTTPQLQIPGASEDCAHLLAPFSWDTCLDLLSTGPRPAGGRTALVFSAHRSVERYSPPKITHHRTFIVYQPEVVLVILQVIIYRLWPENIYLVILPVLIVNQGWPHLEAESAKDREQVTGAILCARLCSLCCLSALH